eukprot:TRINITY_DN10378_c0_g3_i3.p1 TRINITY_DN10378_c0_g3~~TRINITY_DN10378_c0_g3_i3.p1  ORF type:complete len:473 (-),score=68.52 TRINITY_DN10378_c0_g3_i3:142-1560(-)
MAKVVFLCFMWTVFAAIFEKPFVGYRIVLSKQGLVDIYNNIHYTSLKTTAEKYSIKYKQLWSSFLDISFILTDFHLHTFDLSAATTRTSVAGNNVLAIMQENPVTHGVFNFTYRLLVLGWEVYSTTGTFNYHVARCNITQVFEPSKVKAEVKMNTRKSVITIKGFDPFGDVYMKVEELLNSATNNMLDDIFKKELIKKIEEVFNKMAHFNVTPTSRSNLSMMMEGEFLEVSAINRNEFLAFVYGATVVADSKYNKSLYKYIKHPSKYNNFKVQACFGSNLFNAILQLHAHANTLVKTIDPAAIGLTGCVLELAQALPKLEELFGPREQISITCKPNITNDIVMINEAVEDYGDVAQVSLTCSIDSKEREVNILTLQAIVRIVYMWREFLHLEKACELSAFITTNKVQSFSILKSIVPVRDKIFILQIIKSIMKHFADLYIIQDPISVHVPMVYPAKETEYVQTHNIHCFEYR